MPNGERTRPPSVCILILNWNGWKDTIECLESVFRLRYPRFQVVVCDNDSTNGSVERIEAWARGELEAGRPGTGLPWSAPVAKPIPCAVLDRARAERAEVEGEAPLLLVRNGRNAGFAAGNNVGLRFADARGADYVWLLNPDTVVDPDALDALVATAEADPGLGMVGGRLFFYDHPERTQAAAGGTLSRWWGTTALCGEGAPASDELRPGGELAYIHGACLLARTELLHTVGEMDERYFLYSEEVDWCLRARRTGWRLGYAPGCRVWHKEGTSVGVWSPTQEYHLLRSRLILLRSHFPLRYPVGLAYNVVCSIGPKLLRRQPGRLRLVLSVYRDHFGRRAPSTSN